MRRRDFLKMLATAPLLGLLRPVETDDPRVEVLCDAMAEMAQIPPDMISNGHHAFNPPQRWINDYWKGDVINVTQGWETTQYTVTSVTTSY